MQVGVTMMRTIESYSVHRPSKAAAHPLGSSGRRLQVFVGDAVLLARAQAVPRTSRQHLGG